MTALAPMSPKTCELDRWATRQTCTAGVRASIAAGDCPPARVRQPHGCLVAPHGCLVAPHRRLVAPHGRLVTPHGRRIAPHGCRVGGPLRIQIQAWACAQECGVHACVHACVHVCVSACTQRGARLLAFGRLLTRLVAVRGSASTNPRPRRMLRAAHCVLGCYRCNAHLVANAKARAARANLCAPHGTTGGVLRTLSAGAIRGHQAYWQRPDRASAPRPAL